MKMHYWTMVAVMLLPLTGLNSTSHAQQSSAGQQSGQSGQGQAGQGQAGQAGQREAGQGQPGQAGQARTGQGQGQSQGLDHLIASVVAIGNEEEIQLAQIAATRAQNEEVKEFARQMQKEHTELNQRLSQLTGQRITLDGGASGTVIRGQSPDANDRSSNQTDRSSNQSTPSGQTGTPDRDRTSATGQAGQPGQASQLTQAGGSGHEMHQLVQIKREIAQRCLQNAEKELQSLQGNEFDKAYMAHQAVVHGQMLAALQVYQQHASSQLSQTLAQAEQVTERHKEHAKKLCKQLDSSSSTGERSSSSSSSSTNRNQ